MNFVQQCVDANGTLSAENQAILNQLIKNPTEALWFQAKNIVINDKPVTTLQACINQISNIRLPPSVVPDGHTIYRAIKHSVEERQNGLTSSSSSTIRY